MAYKVWDINWLTLGRKTVLISAAVPLHIFPASYPPKEHCPFPPAQASKQYSKGQGVFEAHSWRLGDK